MLGTWVGQTTSTWSQEVTLRDVYDITGLLHDNLCMTEKKLCLCMIALRLIYEQA